MAVSRAEVELRLLVLDEAEDADDALREQVFLRSFKRMREPEDLELQLETAALRTPVQSTVRVLCNCQCVCGTGVYNYSLHTSPIIIYHHWYRFLKRFRA